MRAVSAPIVLLAVLGFASEALAATPTTYASRVAFLAAVGTEVTDDYAPPIYPAGFNIHDNATMSAFLGETDYQSTGFSEWNFHLDTDEYCAGCNGSFRLIFTSTSVTSGGIGVHGFAFDIPGDHTGSYFAYVAFGDGTFQDFALPQPSGFFGLTAPELVVSVHVGLAGGGARTDGSIRIDNLTVAGAGGCSLTCPPNQLVSTDPGACEAVVAYPAPTIGGSCGTVTCAPASGSTFPLGTTPVVCSSSTTPTTCGFDVAVVDTEAPALTCPADLVVAAPPGAQSTVVDFTVPTATDNCSPAGPASCVPDSGASFAAGTTGVVCSASDDSGNDSACGFDVTVGNQTIQEIPTLSALGLAGLALLIAGAALLLLRRPAN